VKITVRLPDDLYAQLHSASEERRMSLNSATVDAIRRGLWQRRKEELIEMLGPFVAQPAWKMYDPVAFNEAVAQFSDLTEGLALDWTRGDW
jgi:hypothetical protein